MGTNRMGLPCPACGSLLTDVKRTCRSSDGHFWRQRACPSCGASFHTVQPAEVHCPSGSVSWHYRIPTIHWAKFRQHFSELVKPTAP